jgi:hypothetical protein
MQAKVAEEFPNANLKILVQSNPDNDVFFTRYQTFFLNGIVYIINHLDTLSMPGVIQLYAMEHYANLIEDDVENNIRNAWNIQPVVPQHITDYAIEGPLTTKPLFETTFRTHFKGGQWVIVENLDLPLGKPGIPAKLLGDVFKQEITAIWDSTKSGMFTIGVLMPGKKLYQKAVIVESLM